MMLMSPVSCCHIVTQTDSFVRSHSTTPHTILGATDWPPASIITQYCTCKYCFHRAYFIYRNMEFSFRYFFGNKKFIPSKYVKKCYFIFLFVVYDLLSDTYAPVFLPLLVPLSSLMSQDKIHFVSVLQRVCSKQVVKQKLFLLEYFQSIFCF